MIAAALVGALIAILAFVRSTRKPPPLTRPWSTRELLLDAAFGALLGVVCWALFSAVL